MMRCHFLCRVLVLVGLGLGLLVGGVRADAKAGAIIPTTFWPDPSTGLMWTGFAGPQMSWDKSNSYCAALNIAGYTVWRLPSKEELTAIMGVENVPKSSYVTPHGNLEMEPSFNVVHFKGNIQFTGRDAVWTTATKDGKYQVVNSQGRIDFIKRTDDRPSPLCVRSMEPDLLALAKQANAPLPVPDLQTLKAYAPYNTAHKLYISGQYQEALTQEKAALAIEPNLNYANWGLGLTYGMLGQWDDAVPVLQALLKADKNNDATKAALKWAEDGQKAAKKGEAFNGKSPAWF